MPAALLCVCIKPAWRTDAPLRLDAARQSVRAGEALPALAAAELAALALALALRERLTPPARVLALSVAPPAGEGVLREALAAGADEVLRVWGRDWPTTLGALDGSGAATRALARAAAAALRPRAPLLVLTGERSADTAQEAFGAFLAAEIGADFAHRVTAAESLAGDGARWRVAVRLERGYGQALELAAPALLTVSAALPKPAYAALPAWLAARRAAVPLEEPPLPAPAPTPGGETTLRIPLPRVKRLPVPGQGLAAEERIRAMVALPAQASGAAPVEGPPEAQAEAVLRLLRERGYL